MEVLTEMGMGSSGLWEPPIGLVYMASNLKVVMRMIRIYKGSLA
jgi:hypothetical protein